MRWKFYLHKRGGVFYACLVNQETGLPISARSTGERDRDAALIVVSGWLRDGLPGKDGERRKIEAAFDLNGILWGIRKAELDSGGALAIVKALKDRGLIDIGAVPAGKGGVDFVRFLSDFFDYDKSAYVRDRLAHGHSIGRRYCRESLKLIRLFWEPAFKGRTLASITRSDLKSFSLALPADKSASYKNSILNAGLIPLGWAYEEGMTPADVGKDFERYGGKAAKRGVLTVEEAGALFAKPWADSAAMSASLLSATTGMRQGEVLAVRGGDIGEAVLNVAHSWSAADGLKSPKNGEARRVSLYTGDGIFSGGDEAQDGGQPGKGMGDDREGVEVPGHGPGPGDKFPDLPGLGIQAFGVQGHSHAPLAAHQVNRQGIGGTPRLFKQEGGPSPTPPHYPSSNDGNLQTRV